VPVILATQVLESMRVEPRPTRAEVNDAASAVYDGVDAIMLAGETAVGSHPTRAVQTLAAIITEAERSPADPAAPSETAGREDHAQALCEAAVTLANRGDAQAIVAVTRAGSTPRRLSALRPRAPIYAVTEREDLARRLILYWGVTPLCIDIGSGIDAAVPVIRERLRARGLSEGSVVVLISVNPDIGLRDANYLRIRQL
jgi:pyruvate kinase